MKTKDRLLNEICYFYFNIEDIPFKEAGIIFDKKIAYVRMLNPVAYVGYTSGYYLSGVYDFFTDKPVLDIAEIKKHDFFFGEVFSFDPLLRGAHKAVFIGSEPWENVDLPHFAGGHFKNQDNDIVSYYTDGFDAPTRWGNIIYNAPETEYKNVKHLHRKTIHTFANLKLFIYIEFLKRQQKGLSDEQLIEKWELCWKDAQEERKKMPERQVEILKRDFILEYRKLPYNEIPKQYRGKAINEVEKGTANKKYSIAQ